MKIIIFDEDYSSINRVHNYIERYCKMNELADVQIALTTRKPNTFKQYAKENEISLAYINLDTPTVKSAHLIDELQQSNPFCTIVGYTMNANIHKMHEQFPTVQSIELLETTIAAECRFTEYVKMLSK
ncbi:hypothetical protein [Kurthia senegalensis]|uniref:hypothetical protein n=1 Tax=Kurthia senegalensis TaxID=1033740 RepID=UPI0002881C18|nr:hypothetical protein [Kurthia senegalensis]